MKSLEVQRLFFEWFFRKDYCFSRDLQSTIQGDYSFYGRLDFQGNVNFIDPFLLVVCFFSIWRGAQHSSKENEFLVFKGGHFPRPVTYHAI